MTNTVPTKAQELAILDRAIDLLGPSSYLGPFFRQVRAEVEQAIRNDFFPVISLDDARQQVASLIAAAEQTRRDADTTAVNIVRVANAQAQAAIAKADQRADDIRTALSAAIRKASGAVDGW